MALSLRSVTHIYKLTSVVDGDTFSVKKFREIKKVNFVNHCAH